MLTAAALRQSVFQIALAYNRRFSAVAAAIPRSVTVYLSLIGNYRKLSEPLAGQIFRFFMYAAATACGVSGGQDVARQQNLFAAVTAAAPQHASIRCSLIGLFQNRQRVKSLGRASQPQLFVTPFFNFLLDNSISLPQSQRQRQIIHPFFRLSVLFNTVNFPYRFPVSSRFISSLRMLLSHNIGAFHRSASPAEASAFPLYA